MVPSREVSEGRKRLLGWRERREYINELNEIRNGDSTDVFTGHICRVDVKLLEGLHVICCEATGNYGAECFLHIKTYMYHNR